MVLAQFVGSEGNLSRNWGPSKCPQNLSPFPAVKLRFRLVLRATLSWDGSSRQDLLILTWTWGNPEQELGILQVSPKNLSPFPAVKLRFRLVLRAGTWQMWWRWRQSLTGFGFRAVCEMRGNPWSGIGALQVGRKF